MLCSFPHLFRLFHFYVVAQDDTQRGNKEIIKEIYNLEYNEKTAQTLMLMLFFKIYIYILFIIKKGWIIFDEIIIKS